MNFFSISGLFLLYIFCIIRIVLPIELPFTKVIGLESIYNKLISFWDIPVWETEFTIKTKHLIIGTWVIVTLILLIRLTYQYIMSLKDINRYDVEITSDYKDLLSTVALEYGKKDTYSSQLF